MSTSPKPLVQSPSARSTAPFHELLVGFAVFISATIAIMLTRVPGGIALFWPASAVAAALLIRLPRLRVWLAGVSVLLAISLANLLVAHRPWAHAVLFGFVNLAEVAMMVGLFRFVWRFPYPDITTGQATLMVTLFGIAAPGAAAVVGGLSLHLLYSMPFRDGTLQWWSSHAVGACLAGPSLILFSIKGCKRLLNRRFLAENLCIAALGLTGCYFAILYVRFPFVSIGLLLMFAAFRMGGLGASFMSLAVGLVITNLWILGIRPVGLDPNAWMRHSLVGLPVLAFLATVMPSIAVGLGSDARRAAGRALRVSERLFRESMEHSPIGMLIADLDGKWNYTNLALQEMLGYTEEEFRALPPGGPSKSEDWQESESRWRRLLSREIDFYDTVRSFQHKDGHWLWTHVAVSVLRDDDGVPLQLIAQIESLEARQLAEATLADERERLKITLGSISDAVITTDAATRITYINAAAASLLGLELKAAEGRRIDEVMHLMDPQTSKAAANLIGQSALHGKVFRREQACLMHRPDGSICYVMDVVTPVLSSTGVVTGMVIVLHDATRDIDRARDLQHRAMHDPLTGLSNRADFEQQLRTVFRRAHHLNRPAAVVMIDLDHFKAVNDAAGHAAGDAVLRKAAEACRSAVRSSDTVARIGGDEFAVILDNCAEKRAIPIGQHLLRLLNPLSLTWEGSQYSVGASIGLAMCSTDMPDEKAWLEAADKASYTAKREGRAGLRIAAGSR